MMRLAGVLSAGLGLDVLSRLQWRSLAQQRDQSDPSKTLTWQTRRRGPCSHSSGAPPRRWLKRTSGTPRRVRLLLGETLPSTTRPPPCGNLSHPNTHLPCPSCTGRIGLFVESVAHHRAVLSGQRIRTVSMALAIGLVPRGSRFTDHSTKLITGLN